MGSRRSRGARAGAAALLLVLVVGCSAGAPPGATAPPASTTGAAPPAPGAPPTSPLTGLPGPSAGAPVLAVKIDNTAQGRPWDGVEDADVVYVSPVEGGLTRLLAVFSSRLPASVGPIRSARESDAEVLRAYGRPALGVSGLAPEIARILDEAPLITVTPESARGVFRRNPGRPAPADLYADPRDLLDGAGDAAPPRDVGFRFGPAPAGGDPVGTRDVRVAGTTVGLRWDAGRGRFAVSMAGRPVLFGDRDEPITAATVVVQRVATRDSVVRDAAGAVSPVAVTVGGGEAEVLRDDRAFAGRWSRPDPGGPTRFTGPDGTDLAFSPGPVWVLLAPIG